MTRAADVLVLGTIRDVSDARLTRLVDALRSAGLSVHVDGVGDPDTAPDGAGATARPRPTMLRRLGRAALIPFASCVGVTNAVDPDAFGPALAARALRRHRFVVCDVYEDYRTVVADRDWASGPVQVIARLVAGLTHAAAARADLTLVADEHVPPQSARERLVVRNLPDLSQLPVGDDSPTPRAVYVGDVRPSRGAITMIEAVRAAPPWQLDVIGPILDGDVRREVRSAIGDCDRIRLHGRLPLREAWSTATGASVGFSLLADTPAYRAAMPTKVYEYLGAGMAVLTTPLPRPAALVDESGAGAVVSGSAEAADMLRRWHERPDDLVALRRRARAWSESQLAGPSPFDRAAQQISRILEGP